MDRSKIRKMEVGRVMRLSNVPAVHIHSYRAAAQWYAASRSPGGNAVTGYRPPAPPGLFGFASQAAARLGAVVARADAARTDALRLIGTVFERKAAASSSPAISASATDRAKSAVYSIDVERIARPQKNIGAALPASGTGGIAAGSHRIEIAAAGRKTEIRFEAAAYDTNATALAKLRDAIQRADAGVHAAIVKDAAAGTIKLQLTAAGTGSDFAFRVTDIEGSAAADIGIDAVADAAVNARYRVNGGPARESSTNTILLDNGNVLATLREDGGGSVRLSVGMNVEEVAKNVKKLVGSYNALRSAVAAARDVLDPLMANAASQLKVNGLEDIGLSRKADGSLAVDELRLREALERRPDTVKRIVSGHGGLAPSIERAASTLTAAPTSALLHPGVRSLQASYPVYNAQRALHPVWLGMSGLQLNTLL